MSKCWNCPSEQGEPVAFIETPQRKAFDLCDRCLKTLGEAFVPFAEDGK